MKSNGKINYLELPARDLAVVKRFFTDVFGWTFADYGEDYSAFFNAGLDGGFHRSAQQSQSGNGAVLPVIYASDLAAMQAKIEAHGGQINRAVFDFPGGRRFHFLDPNGNEWAVWSDDESR